MRAQDFYQQPITRLVDAVVAAYQESLGMHLEVFVHKAEVLSDEHKIGAPCILLCPLDDLTGRSDSFRRCSFWSASTRLPRACTLHLCHTWFLSLSWSDARASYLV